MNNRRYISHEQIMESPDDSTELLLAKIFRGVTKKLNEGGADHEILDFIFESLRPVIPFDRIGIALVTGEGDESQVEIKWAKSDLPVRHLALNYRAKLAGSSLQRIFESGEPRIINDLLKYFMDHPESRSTELILLDGIRSSMTCPLYANGKNFGLVFFSSGITNVYEKENVRTFLAIADELSLVIEQFRLKTLFQSHESATQNFNMTLHDLKSPLSVIQGCLELSHYKDWFRQLSPKDQNIFTIMNRNVTYMSELLTHLRERVNIRTDTVELAGFCTEFETSARIAAQKKNICLRVILKPGLPERVRLDPHNIRRVLDNLVSNALKFSHPGTEILLVIKSRNSRLVFKVSDQGLGIPRGERGRLFREFGKTSTRPTAGESSTGLGLAISRKIVDEHDGKISVRSRVGKGTVFSFWLPLLLES